MKFKCDACEQTIEYVPNIRGNAMPDGWKMHEIKGHHLLLCDLCGNPAAFIGGLSPMLKDLLRERGISFDD